MTLVRYKRLEGASLIPICMRCIFTNILLYMWAWYKGSSEVVEG
jgi:hypothetical protein